MEDSMIDIGNILKDIVMEHWRCFSDKNPYVARNTMGKIIINPSAKEMYWLRCIDAYRLKCRAINSAYHTFNIGLDTNIFKNKTDREICFIVLKRYAVAFMLCYESSQYSIPKLIDAIIKLNDNVDIVKEFKERDGQYYITACINELYTSEILNRLDELDNGTLKLRTEVKPEDISTYEILARLNQFDINKYRLKLGLLGIDADRKLLTEEILLASRRYVLGMQMTKRIDTKSISTHAYRKIAEILLNTNYTDEIAAKMAIKTLTSYKPTRI